MVNEKTLEEFTTTYKETHSEATDEEIKTAYDESLLADMNLTDKVSKVMDDYGTMLIQQMEVRLQKRVDEVIKSTQDELVASIRKGVGLDDDPVIHLSEVSEVVRKMILKQSGDGKKTIEIEKGGPEGQGGKPPVEKFIDDGVELGRGGFWG